MQTATVLRVEGGVIGVLAFGSVIALDAPLWLIAILAFAPDLGMVGYVHSPRVGAITYNVVHWYGLPLLLGVIGILWIGDLAVWSALIWVAHIGVDRAFGYGLKHPDSFGHTHLNADGGAPIDDNDPGSE